VFEPSVSEASPDVLADAFEPTIATPDAPRKRRIFAPTYPRAIALFIIAIVLFVVGTKVLTKSTAEIRVVVCLVALYLGFKSLDLLGKRINGPSFPTGLWLSVSWLVIALFAALSDAFSLLPVAEAQDPSKTLKTPILLRPDLFTSHPLGTDRFGLDILGGVMHGLQVSLIVGLGAVSLALVVGGSIGVISGYFRGGIDKIADTLSNAMLAFPPLIFLLALVAVVRPSVTNVTWALAVISIPVFFRLARANTFVVAQRESVLAARALGATRFRVIVRELVPPVAFSLLAYSFILVALIIVAEASLSFLGLSVPRPEPTLGNMIAANQANLDQTPALVFIPATVLFMTVLSLNRVGEYARARWTPKEAKV
jgi:peptide/nickel transport system permease protein